MEEVTCGEVRRFRYEKKRRVDGDQMRMEDCSA